MCAGATALNIDSMLLTNYGVHRHELYPNLSIDNMSGEDKHFSTYMCVTKSELSNLIARVCDFCDRIGTACPTFILEKY